MRRTIRLLLIVFSFSIFFSAPALGDDPVVKIGINLPLSGDIAETGKEAEQAVQLWQADLQTAGGVTIGGANVPVEVVTEDNRSNAEIAARANRKLIEEDGVLVIVGPLVDKQAIPAGEIANGGATPMLAPFSTSPLTTADRPFVFRNCFIDTTQGEILAKFISEEFNAATAAVLYDSASDAPAAMAESFKTAWETLNGAGSVAAYESFTTRETDYSAQLANILQTGADVLFVPQYAAQVAQIVKQARELGWAKPILGGNSWDTPDTAALCDESCNGLFFSAHYAAIGATGAAQTFNERYEQQFGEAPEKIAALTWDALKIVETALQSVSGLSGDLTADREAVRAALSAVTDFEGITGKTTMTESGDPAKCAAIVRIGDAGEYAFHKTVCP